MFLTSVRIILARDAVERRPRSGVQSFPIAELPRVRLELGNAPSGRIVVSMSTGQEAVSMFFDSRSLDRAQELIEVARPLIARLRRRVPAESDRARTIPTGTDAADGT
jgi:hypothetical protein